jgi:hypothetical protein
MLVSKDMNFGESTTGNYRMSQNGLGNGIVRPQGVRVPGRGSTQSIGLVELETFVVSNCKKAGRRLLERPSPANPAWNNNQNVVFKRAPVANAWTCACKATHYCTAGCAAPHVAHTCTEITKAPTPQPTPKPTPAPTAIPSVSASDICPMQSIVNMLQCTNEPTLTRLYRQTVDGGNGRDWHAKCDGKGPTISIMKATSGYVFGGYASKSWITPDDGFAHGVYDRATRSSSRTPTKARRARSTSTS